MPYLIGRDLDGEFETYEPPTATGQYPTHDTPEQARAALYRHGGDPDTWGVYELREVHR